MKSKSVLFASLLFFADMPVYAANLNEHTSSVRTILSVPTEQIGFTMVKISLDKLIDPKIDEVAILAQLDVLTIQARTIAGPSATDEMKINAVRSVIYKAGSWNGQNPFAYDQGDPLGLNVKNKLLSTYLKTRRGNCISMPILFLILADRLGLNVSLADAPLHVFIRYTNLKGRAFNIETTSGANLARPEWYRQNLPMTDRAIESGLYMRTLKKREIIARMATTVMDWHLINGQYQEAIQIADTILTQFPRDGYTMVKRGTAYGELLRSECIGQFQLSPATVEQRCNMLAANNSKAFEQAELLGWTPAE